MTADNMDGNNKKKRKVRKKEDILLMILGVGVPVIMLLFKVGPAIWNTIVTIVVTIATIIANNIVQIVIFIWIAVVAFLLGRRTRR